VIAIQGTVRKW